MLQHSLQNFAPFFPWNFLRHSLNAVPVRNLQPIRHHNILLLTNSLFLHTHATRRIELHAAHGYLLHQFISPIANQRQDQYGGSLENRIRFVLELFSAVRKEWGGVLGVRLSASDWLEHGWSLPDSVELTLRLKQLGCDYIHVSSGGISPKQQIKLGPNYQVPFAKIVKDQSALPTMTVGLITEPQQAEDILLRGDADLIALARAFLYKPRWTWEAAAALKGHVQASPQYWRCMPREAQGIFDSVQMGMR
jgi:2,4-dienoyl-CoA reductase-like NADH-dependent reductase (Old Yellow Enzyme family)